ncbi:hypothetical protein Cob_v011278 [Colletotrichum orbiculare MAFF 240422]|uniref:Uncharacterized protein n=1 Tax=Colletotrichum orbiculare (strain 104-T / ATCC 96160 / CBS 514.97 / LARS 414 / MAFF 240422) TaxID=1213857 RepID=A0A484FBT0_COLOR|nr:hypothetical protein Cob_v011278 [Colletotrichum orbiculare MAFF 240422]
MKPVVILALVGTAMAYLACRPPTSAEVAHPCLTSAQADGCKGLCRTNCIGTNKSYCVNKANNDYDCVCTAEE